MLTNAKERRPQMVGRTHTVTVASTESCAKDDNEDIDGEFFSCSERRQMGIGSAHLSRAVADRLGVSTGVHVQAVPHASAQEGRQ